MSRRLRPVVCILPLVLASACAKSVLVLVDGGVSDADASNPSDSGLDAADSSDADSADATMQRDGGSRDGSMAVVDAGGSDAGGSCSPTGAWSDGAATFVFANDGTFTMTPNRETTVSGTFTYSDGRIVMTNTSYTSTRSKVHPCIGIVGVYSLTFDASCSRVTFDVVSDACKQRVKKAAGVTLTRR